MKRGAKGGQGTREPVNVLAQSPLATYRDRGDPRDGESKNWVEGKPRLASSCSADMPPTFEITSSVLGVRTLALINRIRCTTLLID